MKKTIYLLVFVIALFSCKKESNIPSSTLPNPTNSITCVDNPNINFTSIGTPIGKFGECIKDIDGNTYKTVTIGTQTWMAENLKVSKYNDGTAIPNVTENSQWQKLTTGAWCNYNNSDSLGKIFGKLYNWYTVSPITNGNKNVCPTGWHIPSNLEWGVFFEYFGGINIIANKLKEIDTLNWSKYNVNSNNISLFTVTPAGERDTNGSFKSKRTVSLFWSQFEYTNFDALSIYIGDANNEADIESENKKNGFSLRCLKD